MGLERLTVNNSDKIDTVLLFTGDCIGNRGPRFVVMFKDKQRVEASLTVENVQHFIVSYPEVDDAVKQKLSASAASCVVPKASAFDKLTYANLEEQMFVRRDELDRYKAKASVLIKMTCILPAGDARGVTIYTTVPEQDYQDVLDCGLKSYWQVKGEKRGQIIAGHDDSIFFRPGFWNITEEALAERPLIGITVNPAKILITNQEIRKTCRTKVDPHVMYVASSISYDDFNRQMQDNSKQCPMLFPFSQPDGRLVWQTIEQGEKRKLLSYVPEIVINVGDKTIPPKMFAHTRKAKVVSNTDLRKSLGM